MRDWRGSDGESGEAVVKRGGEVEVGDDDAAVGAVGLERGNLLGQLKKNFMLSALALPQVEFSFEISTSPLEEIYISHI